MTEAVTCQTEATKGILPDHMIAALAEAAGFVPRARSTPTRSSRRASICGSGSIAYPRARELPAGPRTTVAERIDELKLHEIALTDGAVLETGCVYIVPLLESLALPDDIAACRQSRRARPAGSTCSPA